MHVSKQHYLFSYGTLRDPALQKILFGNVIEMQSSRLDGWSLYRATDGYLFIKPSNNASVEGMLLSLTGEQLRRADQWEEVPLYIRELVDVSTATNQKMQAWVYTRRNYDGIVVTKESVSMLTQSDIKKAAISFVNQLQ